MPKPPPGGRPPGEPPTTVEVHADLFRSLYNLHTRLLLRRGELEHSIRPESRVFVMGRGPECDLMMDNAYVSRTHARIVYRQGRFVLIDQSRNGTYVYPRDGTPVLLGEQDEFPLFGTGEIALGQSADEAGEDLLRYRLVQEAVRGE